jgi:hypothetical protein
VSEWGDISICWPGIRIMYPSGVTDRYVTPLGHIILIPGLQIDMSHPSDTHYPDSEPTDRYVTPLGHISDISICRTGIRIMCPSGVTYLSVGSESG